MVDTLVSNLSALIAVLIAIVGAFWATAALIYMLAKRTKAESINVSAFGVNLSIGMTRKRESLASAEEG